ncbi:hypothetical protein NML43_13135 [Rhodopseudomonas palustris]|uniref:hypothetical protein n=1 Tax=Rhodopseudomonas palustris TaxID=1076 RepID=UPI0020CD01C6|nr:hypothetical protein [Rhodopseudomonas palustris]MBR2120136.1 hypothetical protein [Afipia sp.]MCP9628033.1 hypothetical protein [Rhodopseudomonas palustris]
MEAKVTALARHFGFQRGHRISAVQCCVEGKIGWSDVASELRPGSFRNQRHQQLEEQKGKHIVCDHVTNVIRKACAEPFFGTNLINLISGRISKRLEMDPQPTITFNLWCGEVAGPTERVNVRVEFFRKDWEHLRGALEAGDGGSWNEETLLYSGDLFEVSANAADQEVLVVFW